MCRVCGFNTNEELISPCKCEPPMIHRSCLKNQCLEKLCAGFEIKELVRCSLCNYSFNYKYELIKTILLNKNLPFISAYVLCFVLIIFTMYISSKMSNSILSGLMGFTVVCAMLSGILTSLLNLHRNHKNLKTPEHFRDNMFSLSATHISDLISVLEICLKYLQFFGIVKMTTSVLDI
jgi:hypothetical protein